MRVLSKFGLSKLSQFGLLVVDKYFFYTNQCSMFSLHSDKCFCRKVDLSGLLCLFLESYCTLLDLVVFVAPSRRGDLEILGYCMIQWLSGCLPWEDNLKDPNYVRDSKIR